MMPGPGTSHTGEDGPGFLHIAGQGACEKHLFFSETAM